MYKKLQILCLIAATNLLAITYNVTLTTDSPSTTAGEGAPGELRHGINQINQGIDGYDIIDFSGLPAGSTVSLNAPLPVLNLSNSDLTQIIGNGAFLDGQSQYPGFFANQGTITIENFNFQNCTSRGGDGGDGQFGGGGGPGFGGALLNFGAEVTLDNVNFDNSTALGGNLGVRTMIPTDGCGGGGGMWSFFNGIEFTARGGDGGPGAGGGGGGIGASGGNVTIMDFAGGGGGVSGGTSRSARGGDSALAGSFGAGYDSFGSLPGGMGFDATIGGAGGLVGGGGGGAGKAGGGGGGGNSGASALDLLAAMDQLLAAAAAAVLDSIQIPQMLMAAQVALMAAAAAVQVLVERMLDLADKAESTQAAAAQVLETVMWAENLPLVETVVLAAAAVAGALVFQASRMYLVVLAEEALKVHSYLAAAALPVLQKKYWISLVA